MNPDATPTHKTPLIAPQFVPVLMAIVVTFMTWLLVQEIRVSDRWHAILFGVVTILTLLHQRWIIYTVLALTVLARLQDGSSPMSPGAIYLAVVMLGYITFCFRYTDLSRDYGSEISGSTGHGPGRNPNQKNPWLSLHPFLSGWLWIPASLVLAIIVLAMFPFDPTTDQRLAITPGGMRAISIVWFLAVVWFVIEGAAALFARRQKDAVREGVYVRSVFCRLLNSELSSIEKRRGKAIKNLQSGSEKR